MRGASISAIARHGIDDETYEALLEKQGGCCAICRRFVERLVIDHAHECCPGNGDTRWPNCGLCVRGLLCYRCNLMVGIVESTPPETLKRAFDYVAGTNPRGYLPRQLDPLRVIGGPVA